MSEHREKQTSQTEPHFSLITGPQAWCAHDFQQAANWEIELSCETIETLIDLTKHVDISLVRNADNFASLPTCASLPTDACRADSLRITNSLRDGPGFVVVKGLPIDRYPDALILHMQFLFVSWLGIPLAQDDRGSNMYFVQGETRSYGLRPGVLPRGETSSEKLEFHTDSAPAYRGVTPDFVSLLCLNPASAGGETRVASAATIHNTILQESSELLAQCYEPFLFDNSAGMNFSSGLPFRAPIFQYRQRLAARFNRLYIVRGFMRANQTMSAREREAIGLFASACNLEVTSFRFLLRRGELLCINNRTILHGRERFEDAAEYSARRLLARTWLSVSKRDGE
jgi:hypothetical protein